MPYASNAELPEGVRSRLSDACQTVWRNTYTGVMAEKTGGQSTEGQAIAIANVAGRRCMEQAEKSIVVPIAKRDVPRQVAYGVVLEPLTEDSPDLQGDWYTAEDIEEAAHGFMSRVTKGDGFSDLMHDGVTRAGYPVESFIAPVDYMLGDQQVPAGAWVVAMHYPDPEVWDAIVKGRLSAFSVGGSGARD